MPSNPSTPDGGPTHAPTHTTYEIAIPVRANRTPSQSTQPSRPSTPGESAKTGESSKTEESSNPKIQIPKITPVPGPSPEQLAKGLEGKYVDEFGNILDWDGTVLGRVEGDLPSMIGRPVTASGEIFDADGEVVGHVSENHKRPNLKPLSGSLKVDDEGNIYDDIGNVVGKIHSPQGEAEAPKPASAPRPDELYLDVKSTFDGIQLIIKIPTVFNRPPDIR